MRSIICLLIFISNALIATAMTDTIPSIDTVGKIFETVEVEASFPAGEKAWLRFVTNNVNPQVPAKKKAPGGTYTVLIEFVVDQHGQLTDFRALTSHGYGMEEEVIRMLKTSPRWNPAIQRGRNVKAYRRQPVTFQVEEVRKRKREKDGV